MPPKGWPKGLSDIEYPSSLLVENISYLVTSVSESEPMDITGSVEGEIQVDGGRVDPVTRRTKGL